MTSGPNPSRREVLAVLRALGLGAAVAAVGGCRLDDDDDDEFEPDLEDLDVELTDVRANIEAALDVMLPGEWEDGQLIRPGAVECGAFTVLQLDNLIGLSVGLGLLPALPDWIDEAAVSFDLVTRGLISVELDRIGSDVALLTSFRDLDRQQQEQAIANAFVHPDRAPLMRVLRSIAMLAYLGAITSDIGLIDIGYPPFEDFADRLAVSGYPRTVTDGRLIDAQTEDLAALAAAGELDDYTYNESPAPTPGDDLSQVLDADGDLR